MIPGPAAYPCFSVSAYLSVVCCIVCLHALYTYTCAPTRASLVQARCNLWEMRTAHPRGVEKGCTRACLARACVVSCTCSLAHTLACGHVCHCLIRHTFIQSIRVCRVRVTLLLLPLVPRLIDIQRISIRCRGTNPHTGYQP